VPLQLAKQPGRRTCAGLHVLVRRHLNGEHSQAIARLASEELRLRALHSRRVAEAIPSFDFAAMMEQALKEAQPRIEELKRLARSQEALAENSADERDGRSENPSPGGTTSTGS